MFSDILWTEDAFAFQTFVRSVASTMEEGQALWYLIQNQYVYKEAKQIPTGSFRWNARIIASVCGGDYMDYYCACEIGYYGGNAGHFTKETREKIAQKLTELGIVLKDVEI